MPPVKPLIIGQAPARGYGFRDWTPEEQWAWVAGFIDGEGCFGATKSRRTQKYQSIRLSIAQVELLVLERVQHMMGGRIYGPRVREGNHQQSIYTLYLYRPNITHLWKYLGQKKRRQYKTCLLKIGYGQ